jgi:hypothetical protein
MEVTVKTPALALITLLALGPVAAHQEAATSSQVERAFQQGGRISLDLAAGEYDIRGSAVDTIRISLADAPAGGLGARARGGGGAGKHGDD